MSNFAEDRMAVCNSCEFRHEDACVICGCMLEQKTADPNQSCPLPYGAKWGIYIEPIQAVVPTMIAMETQAAPAVPPPRPPCQSCTKRR